MQSAVKVVRRLAAIAFADIAGWTKLVEADALATGAAWKLIQRSIIQPHLPDFSGRLVEVAGDAVLVEFASAVDAVRWAVDLQRRLEERRAEQGNDGADPDADRDQHRGRDRRGEQPARRRRQRRFARASVGRARRDRGDPGRCATSSGTSCRWRFRISASSASRMSAGRSGPTGCCPISAVPVPARRCRWPGRTGRRSRCCRSAAKAATRALLRRRHDRGNHRLAVAQPVALRHRPQFDAEVPQPRLDRV